jgi:hypothetical protein
MASLHFAKVGKCGILKEALSKNKSVCERIGDRKGGREGGEERIEEIFIYILNFIVFFTANQ